MDSTDILKKVDHQLKNIADFVVGDIFLPNLFIIHRGRNYGNIKKKLINYLTLLTFTILLPVPHLKH